MGVGASARGGAHVKLSDFNHIYDLGNKRAVPRCLQKIGEGRGVGSTFWWQGGLQPFRRNTRFNKGKPARQSPIMHSIHPLCIAESFRKTGSHTGSGGGENVQR